VTLSVNRRLLLRLHMSKKYPFMVALMWHGLGLRLRYFWRQDCHHVFSCICKWMGSKKAPQTDHHIWSPYNRVCFFSHTIQQLMQLSKFRTRNGDSSKTTKHVGLPCDKLCLQLNLNQGTRWWNRPNTSFKYQRMTGPLS